MTSGYTAKHGGDALEVSSRAGLPTGAVLDFSQNVNPYGPPPGVFEAIKSSAQYIRFYPERSYSRLRGAIANHIGVGADGVIVGCGATEIIHSLLARFVRKGPVVVPLPSFSEYEAAASALGLEVRFVHPEGLRVDLENVLDLIREGAAKCAIVCNPNNPTGEVLDRGLLQELAETAEERGAMVIVDEAYLDLCEGGEAMTMAPAAYESENLFVLRSLTKPFGFPGLRVGYAVCSPDSASKYESTAISWRVGVIEEAAAISALKESGFLESSREKIFAGKGSLVRGIASIKGLRPIESKANFLMVDVSGAGLSPRNLRWRLLSYGVLVRELSSVKGLPGSMIRVCVRRPEENRILLEAMRNVIYSLEKVYPNYPNCGERNCHGGIVDCRLCFCPFYPCLDGATGGSFVDRENGGIVWGCKDCGWVHRPEVADSVLEGLSGIDVRSADPEIVLGVRKRVLGVHPP
ncbi:MAG: aminotransferase class I/II-fold pyridoxal phosphate-dependent enzyme [Candidatus Verstraetearchaeota archaeon]|nr:aminotransferase class I/II-fold pyridoxal phosphate-dependent enzyme [Candidatus Verstraetearchaeota archaeon]